MWLCLACVSWDVDLLDDTKVSTVTDSGGQVDSAPPDGTTGSDSGARASVDSKSRRSS